MRLDEAVRLFVNNYTSADTCRAYSGALNPMVDYIGAGRPLDEVRPVDLVAYLQHLQSSRQLAPATLNKHIKTIKTFFNWCVKVDELPASPAAQAIKSKRIPRTVPHEKAMSQAHVEQLLDWAKWHTFHNALILFIKESGVRIGGAAGLRVGDLRLDLDIPEATVTEKGDKTHTVWFADGARQALRLWLIKRKGDHGDYVFSDSGAPVRAETLAQRFRRACISAGIGSYGPHSLRHKLGHDMADAGVPVTVAATVLNHDNPQTTMEFYYPRDAKRAAQVVHDLAKSDAKKTPITVLPRQKSGS